jgi:hypothetical protein
MSNAAVGLVYETIIADVISAVRVDFEENGVDDGALEDLKKVRLYPSLSLVPSRPTAACTAALPPPFLAIIPGPCQSDNSISRFVIGVQRLERPSAGSASIVLVSQRDKCRASPSGGCL